MKIESIADIIKAVQPLLKAKTVLYTVLVLALAFWIGFLFPQIFHFLNLDNWRANNDALMGWGVVATSILLLIVLLVNFDKWISGKLRKRREKRDINHLLSNLGSDELIYLYQYIRNRTLLVEFDETDPIVGLLNAKGLIHPSTSRIRIGEIIRYRSSYHHGQPFEISPFLYRHLIDHPEIFRKLAEQYKPE
jgi:hypothetical protein